MTTIESLQAIMPAMMAAGIDLNPVARAIEELSLSTAPQPPVVGETLDLLDRAKLMKAMDDLVYAVRQHWGTGSEQHNLVRDVCDLIAKVPAIRSLSPGGGRG